MTKERFTIEGKVAPPAFVPWIACHAQRLGLHARIVQSGPRNIVVDLAGPPDLLDAMEMGCLLGPIEVWVEAIHRDASTGPATS